jgi:hypothetical protein
MGVGRGGWKQEHPNRSGETCTLIVLGHLQEYNNSTSRLCMCLFFSWLLVHTLFLGLRLLLHYPGSMGSAYFILLNYLKQSNYFQMPSSSGFLN